MGWPAGRVAAKCGGGRHTAGGGWACRWRPASGIVRATPPIAPTVTPFEWRQLSHACGEVAEKCLARAAELAGNDAARGFIISAELFERLARRCLEMTRPE